MANDHPRPWATSTRRRRLPKDWPNRRRQVLDRDRHRCRINGPNCTVEATEVDHIVNNDDHELANLQAVCSPCHKAKTRAEAQAAKAAAPRRTRPAEPHPGLTTPGGVPPPR